MWHYSQKLIRNYENYRYLLVLEGVSSAESCLGGRPSAPSKSTVTAATYYSHGKMTAPSHRSPSGMMSEHLMDARGEAVLTWFREDFLVRTSPPQVEGLDSTDNVVVCGEKWRESSERFALALSSLKTALCSSVEGSPSSYPILPPWGMMRDGELLARETPEPLTRGTAFGLWPTPLADGDRRSNYAQGGTSLGYAVRNWPTPTCHDSKGSEAKRGKNAQGGPTLTETVGGPLNPGFVEWLMGWPIGWTDTRAKLPQSTADWRDPAMWWTEERAPRTSTSVPARAHRLRALGNGQVPAAAVLAWRTLTADLQACYP